MPPKTNVFSYYCHGLSLALRLGVCWAHFSRAGRGLAPRGKRSVPKPGSRGQGSCRVTPHPTHCAQGLQVSSAYAGSRSEPAPCIWQTEVTFHRGEPFTQQISSSVCFCNLNSNCDNKNGSPETFGVLMNSFSKSIGKKRHNCGCLAINRKINHTTWCSLQIKAVCSSKKDIVERETMY